MAAATAESSVGKKVTYYTTRLCIVPRPPGARGHKTEMYNFATLVFCTTEVLTPF
jgi:hypothetical protein